MLEYLPLYGESQVIKSKTQFMLNVDLILFSPLYSQEQ